MAHSEKRLILSAVASVGLWRSAQRIWHGSDCGPKPQPVLQLDHSLQTLFSSHEISSFEQCSTTQSPCAVVVVTMTAKTIAPSMRGDLLRVRWGERSERQDSFSYYYVLGRESLEPSTGSMLVVYTTREGKCIYGQDTFTLPHCRYVQY